MKDRKGNNINDLWLNNVKAMNPLQVVESALPGFPKLSLGLPLHLTGILELGGKVATEFPEVAPTWKVEGGGYRSISRP